MGELSDRERPLVIETNQHLASVPLYPPPATPGRSRLLLALRAIDLDQRLQELPADHAVLFHERAEVPERDAGAREVARGEHRAFD